MINIHRFEELPSTNTWLLQHGRCGDVCIADSQTAGRGRQQRQWQSPAGKNLYFSLYWCFGEVLPHYHLLGLVVGLAVAETLKTLGVEDHGLKWPNDIYYQNKKLGGILLQTAQPVQHVVIGVGLNVNMFENDEAMKSIDQPWISLATILQNPVDRDSLLSIFLDKLVPRLQQFPQLDRTQFQAEWRQWDVLFNKPVHVHLAQETLTGVARGIDEQGQICVQMDNGCWQSFSAADVSVRL